MSQVLIPDSSNGTSKVLRVETGGNPVADRLVSLDALRGIAILLVIVHHVWFRFPAAQTSALAKVVAGIGWAGVDLFFAISGYLITTILLRVPDGGSLRPFYIKRFFRIVPIYMIAVAAYVAVALLTGHDAEIIHRVWINLMMLTAWAIPLLGEGGVPYTITWSVSVEEFAYLLLGAMLMAGRARFVKGLRWLVLLAFILRLLSIALFALDPITLYYFAPGRVDAIAMGGVLAALSPNVINRIVAPVWLPWLTWFCVVLACSALKRESVSVATVGYSLIAVASAWLVICVVKSADGRSWHVTRWFASFGLVSYFIYLFHGFAIGVLAMFLPGSVASVMGIWVLSALVATATYIAAKISWHAVEYPLILRGRRLARRYEAAKE